MYAIRWLLVLALTFALAGCSSKPAQQTQDPKAEQEEARALSNRTEVHIKNGDLQAARKDAEAALAADPKSVDALTARGLVHLADRSYDNAIADFTGALGAAPKHVKALTGRGKAYLEKGEWDRAIADFAAAMEIAPDVELHVLRATAHVHNNQVASATVYLTAALKLQPKTVDAFTQRGYLFVLVGNFDAAIADLTAALELDENHYPARLERAYAYWGKGDTEKARADCALVTGPGVSIEMRAHANRLASRIEQQQPFKR